MIDISFGTKEEGIDYIVRPGTYGIGFGISDDSKVIPLHVDDLRELQSMSKEQMQRLYVGVVKTPRGFFLPGGGIEEGEDEKLCLEREFIEETGYKINSGTYLGVSRLAGVTPKSKRFVELEGHFYIVDFVEFVGGQCEEDHEFMWISFERAREEILLEHQRYVFNSLFAVEE